MTLFLDTCIIIYLSEGAEGFAAPISAALRQSPAARLCINDLVRPDHLT